MPEASKSERSQKESKIDVSVLTRSVDESRRELAALFPDDQVSESEETVYVINEGGGLAGVTRELFGDSVNYIITFITYDEDGNPAEHKVSSSDVIRKIHGYYEARRHNDDTDLAFENAKDSAGGFNDAASKVLKAVSELTD